MSFIYARGISGSVGFSRRWKKKTIVAIYINYEWTAQMLSTANYCCIDAITFRHTEVLLHFGVMFTFSSRRHSIHFSCLFTWQVKVMAPVHGEAHHPMPVPNMVDLTMRDDELSHLWQLPPYPWMARMELPLTWRAHLFFRRGGSKRSSGITKLIWNDRGYLPVYSAGW